MGETKRSRTEEPTPPTSSSSDPKEPKSPEPPHSPRRKAYRPQVSLLQPSHKKKRSTKVFHLFRSIFRSLPIITPVCKMPSLPESRRPTRSSRLVTGTLFGYRKGKVTFCIQESPMCFPTLLVELAMQTSSLQREMSSGMVRIALECERRREKDRLLLLAEPLWTMYYNGKKSGYAVKREENEEDLNVMELLKPVSMGAGVLPGSSDIEGPDGEIAYVRARFDRVVGSRDSETFYMLSPEGNTGPELTIFFIRI